MSDADQTTPSSGSIVSMIAASILIGAIIVYGGFVLEQLWNWFLPVFTPIRLNIPEAIGLMCVLSHLKGYKYKKTEGSALKAGAYLLFGITFTLTIGWIAHMWSAR